MLNKKIITYISLFSLLVVAGVLTSVFVSAQPQVCGDGFVQQPNDNGDDEMCDEGASNGPANPNCSSTCEAKGSGWGWTSTAGWISFSCHNLGSCGTVDYYAKITNDGDVEGWGWSPNIGWVCLGDQCSSNPPAPFGHKTVSMNPIIENSTLTGWELDGFAKYVSLGDSGWISLSCKNNEENQFFKDFSITTNEDDGHGVPFGPDWYPDSVSSGLGRYLGFDVNHGYRFQNVTLPQGTTVNNAILKLKTGAVPGTPDINIFGRDEDDAPAWSVLSSPALMPKTTASTNWPLSEILPDQDKIDIDVTSIVQEIVDRPGWTSGNSMSIGAFPNNDDANSAVIIFFRDSSQAEAPELAITYTTGTAGNFCDNVSNFGVTIMNQEYCSNFSAGQTACINAGCVYDLSAGACRAGMKGYAWNSSIGWLYATSTFNLVPPWLQTRFGDIYAQRGFTGDQPEGQFTSTYRILSSGALSPELKSESGDTTLWVDPLFGPIDFPTPDTQFSNVLGRIDVDSLIGCEFGTEDNSCINQFGDTVNEVVDQNDIPAVLNGEIYYYNESGPLVLDKIPFIISNGIDFEDGAGTIIIDGDLEINSDIIYSSATLNRFKNLASVAWIIRGDLKIGPDVQDLVGNFIVMGDGDECDPDEEFDHINNIGCGQIDSCSTISPGLCGKPLQVSGMMMARKFYFDRTFINATIGSEVIIYDGRLLANTPPGITDFAQALPIWRAGAFSQ